MNKYSGFKIKFNILETFIDPYSIDTIYDHLSYKYDLPITETDITIDYMKHQLRETDNNLYLYKSESIDDKDIKHIVYSLILLKFEYIKENK